MFVISKNNNNLYDYRMQKNTKEIFRRWLDNGLSKPGKTNSELAKLLGIPQPRVSEMRKGARNIQSAELKIISEYIAEPLPQEVRPTELIEIATTEHHIKLCGEVQAGIWKTPEELEDFESEFLDIPLPEEYRRLKLFGLRVVGNSMNLLYPEGTILLCCHLEELHEAPIHGKKYIIQDIDPHGGIETTVKEFQLDEEGRPWAWPRSMSPEFQVPIALDRGHKSHTIQLKARVLFAVRKE